MERKLGSEQLAAFEQNGYILLKGFFTTEKALEANSWLKNQDQEKLARTWTDQEPGVPLAVYQNIHKGDTPLAQVAGDPGILEVAAELMNDKVYVWSSKVNLKAAWCGTVEYYHQDYAYWYGRGYEKVNMLTCITFIDSHSPENGGLQVIPGSHKYGFLDHADFININGLSKFMIPPKKMTELYSKHGVDAIHAEPGDVLFFHAGLVHGSSHNISPKNRMIILSQLNTFQNLPTDVKSKSKAFNLDRVTKEINEAKRRVEWFQKKYDEQLMSDDVTFNSPIPEAEK